MRLPWNLLNIRNIPTGYMQNVIFFNRIWVLNKQEEFTGSVAYEKQNRHHHNLFEMKLRGQGHVIGLIFNCCIVKPPLCGHLIITDSYLCPWLKPLPFQPLLYGHLLKQTTDTCFLPNQQISIESLYRELGHFLVNLCPFLLLLVF